MRDIRNLRLLPGLVRVELAGQGKRAIETGSERRREIERTRRVTDPAEVQGHVSERRGLHDGGLLRGRAVKRRECSEVREPGVSGAERVDEHDCMCSAE